ncbi:hypothetical protein ACJMK2_017553 [Sinanodonta woodiana]|uniref:Cx9C motif-containing protein 4 n=1 Tax=Sinanodonta woodiana TaxID=1069815 RepID=A0ABD3UE84_SINWO
MVKVSAMVKKRLELDPCQKEACEIQKCLQAHNYKESACKDVLEAMRKCCENFRSDSKCCSGIHSKSNSQSGLLMK